MANIEFDPIVNRMSKRVGNFVYSNWKGRNVIRKYTEKRKTESTPAQQKICSGILLVRPKPDKLTSASTPSRKILLAKLSPGVSFPA